ncbi:cytochrome ubiquinol oxidase subunit I [Pseudonocardia sp. T1-2H]|uniref:cytochrome ubiquinol oxidase subunit I n=1 Tax=Pseudonocardia sp. T1-2H TaxID=3128899 RepID=UPI003100DD51
MIATFEGLAAFAAVDPVPWARAQMAFTLMFHIILVPLGVSWAFMTLIANYRAVKHSDRDALMLAQRWSKYMAVTFAVGAVTGTVLSFEFGLLWPRFMGQWGEAFGVPFAFEGLFFFTEAIFIALYIFGWRRLKPWAHFWTGVPIVVAGIFGSVSVVAANAWMNAPTGFTTDSAGTVVSVDPVRVIFNDAMPLQAAHMVVAAYLVGGFLIASVYATAMLRGRTDRYHRLGFIIAFSVAAVATPIQMGVGDSLARWVYTNQPVKFAAIELVPTTSSDVPETILGRLNDDGTVSGGIPLPGLASWLSDPSTGRATVVQGLDTVPPDARPTVGQVNIVHLAWDVMVGLGTLLFLLSAWYGLCWIIRRRMPASRWFLRVAAASGVLAVIAMEAGWIVTEVGRQPWIVYELMKVEGAATGNTGVWISFGAVVLLYLAVGITTILVLRGMSRRFRRAGGFVDLETPYSPSTPSAPPAPSASSAPSTPSAPSASSAPPTSPEKASPAPEEELR